ncbi:MAG TPA: hypothetical protein DD379_25205 [Cyanobacteria bacterium UBA11162]|nr:hypothetical protein [Cyanobacteria bacterium UBA11162]
MNCERFDEVIRNAFSNYGPIGVSVQLLSLTDKKTPTPPGDWYSVTLEVEPVTAEPYPYAETWYYGGVISHEKGRVPLGIRPIDKDKLIGCCKAAEKLPPGFPLKEASGELSWFLTPSVDEPLYQFHHGQALCVVGAYSGEVKSCNVN